MGSFPDIVFARGELVPWALTAAAILLVLTLYSYRRGGMSRRLKVAAFLVRAGGIGLLLFCWLEPMVRWERPKPQSNAFAILIDNSGSTGALMEQGSRGPEDEDAELPSALADLLADESPWLTELTETFRVRKYLFDQALRPIDSIREWTGQGPSSEILEALRQLQGRFEQQPLAGILLLTDGRETSSPANRASAWTDTGWTGIPIYPLPMPGLGSHRDLAIRDLTVAQSEFETAPVTLTVLLGQNGFSNGEAVVSLYDDSHREVESQTVRLRSDAGDTSCQFRFRPEKSGITSYSVTVRSKSDSSWTGAALLTEPNLKSSFELTLANNRRDVAVDRGLGPYRVLYLSGRPNWEFKYLRRALDEDPEIELTSLIRIANREPKFSFRDSKMEETNSLFSGFEDISEEEKAKYDEPVFARLGTRASGELQKGFPRDAEELFAYSALILDDVEHDFLTQDQQQLVRQFVTLRGGALLALGGQESMRGRDFQASVLGQLLPVYGDPKRAETFVPDGEIPEGKTLRFQLTRDGWLSTSLRLEATESAEQKRLQAMPSFRVWNDTSKIKPGASILVEGELDDQTRIPLLISQRFGRGRAASLLLGDFWRWGLRFDGDDTSPLSQAWRQWVRSMISDVPRSISIRAVTDPKNARLVNVLATVLGRDFQIVDNAKVSLEFTTPTGEVLRSQASPSFDQVGEFRSELVMSAPGVYRVSCEVRAPDGSLLGTAQTAWDFSPNATEFSRLGNDSMFLAEIAQRSGGRVLQTSHLDSLASMLPADTIPIREAWTVPLWHSPWILALAIALLVLEWWLRRRYGLA